LIFWTEKRGKVFEGRKEEEGKDAYIPLWEEKEGGEGDSSQSPISFFERERGRGEKNAFMSECAGEKRKKGPPWNIGRQGGGKRKKNQKEGKTLCISPLPILGEAVSLKIPPHHREEGEKSGNCKKKGREKFEDIVRELKERRGGRKNDTVIYRVDGKKRGKRNLKEKKA